MKTKFSRVLGVITALLMFVPLSSDFSTIVGSLKVSAEETEFTVIEPQDEINRDEVLETFTEPAYTPMFSFPVEMRGVYITPTIDYALVGSDGSPLSDEDILIDVENMLDKVEENRLNSIIINTDYKGEIFYSTDVNQTVKRAAAEYAIDAAKERGLYVYLNFSINSILGQLENMDLQSRIDYLALKVHSFAVKYPVDGIILDGYYSSKNQTALNDYISNGSGIGFDNWLMDNGAYVFSLASDAIRKTNNTIPVGISLNDVWANYSSNENGSETSVNFQALSDGYADTVSYIQNGYADFVIIIASGSRASTSMPFNSIVGWWDKYAAAADIPMFVNHLNEKVCSDYKGWGSPDELVKQVIEAGEFSSYRGSAFNSYYALNQNTMQSTTALIKHYDDQIDIEGLNSELEMTLPTKTSFKTEEPSVIFAGSFDPNFPVYYQGKEITLNEAGRFYFTEELDVGVNTFKFQNKAKVITYKITRTVNVLKSVAPTGDTMRVEEQSTISLSAIAYKGSTVSAKINGKQITLKEVKGQLDELDPNSNYTKFVGKYTAPQGQKGKDIDLGNVEFYGTYPTKSGNINESRTGAKIIVNALPEVLNDYSGSLLVVNNDNTMVYNYKTTDTAPTPDMARLPAGTVDYIVKTVTYAGTDYYLTNSGKRIRTNAVSIQSNRALGSNPISVEAVGKDGTDTIIKLKTNSKIPFSINYNGQGFNDGDNGSYYISSFDASSVTITFDYITSISSGDLKFPDSAVFTTGKWSTSTSGEMTKTKLTLNLRQQGIYSGVSATYDSNDSLILRFNGCRNSLNGATIVIDPGHGYTGASAFDPGAVGHVKEQVANLAIAKYVVGYLEDEGATVYRLKTESDTYVTDQRASIARQYKPDIFISIHCNAAGESAKGAEAFYFTPFSQPLAKYVSSALGTYLSDQVHGGGDLNRGAKYNYFYVTQQQEFASILVETAFVTNYTEAMALANSTHQKGFAKAIVSGVKKYFAQCGYSCFGDGDGSVLENDNSELPAEEEPEYPETEPMTTEDVETDDFTDNQDSVVTDFDDNNNDNNNPDDFTDLFNNNSDNSDSIDFNDPFYQYFGY